MHDIDRTSSEYFGDDEIFAAQRHLFENHRELKRVPGCATQGRTLVVTGSSRASLLDGLERCARVPRLLARCSVEDADFIREHLRSTGRTVGRNLSVLVGNRDSILAAFQEKNAEPMGVQFFGVHRDARHVRALQELQVRNGIVPVPGWVLRGRDAEGSVSAYALIRGAVVGGASAMMVGSPVGGTALVFAVAVSRYVRGGGFGFGLVQAVLRRVLESGASEVGLILENDDGRLEKFYGRLGLARSGAETYLFAEL